MLSKIFHHRGLIVLILLLAAFLRLYRLPEYMEFLGDQGRDMLIIRDLLKNGNLFFIGPTTSMGHMYLGPYYYYLIAPFLLIFNFNPIGPSVFVALLSVLTCYLIYKISCAWFNKPIAFLSSLLFAISPVVIKYSNFSWNPNVMPLFSLLFIYFVSQAVFKNKPRDLLFATLAFIMAINSHYLAVLLLPPAFLLLLYKFLKVKKDSKNPNKSFSLYLLLSFLLFLVSLTPQILFDIRHNGQNINAFISFFFDRQSGTGFNLIKYFQSIPQITFLIFGRLITAKYLNIGLLFTIFSSLFVLVKIINILKTKSYSQNKYFILLVTWIASGILGLSLYNLQLDHYFGFLYPAVFILTAFFIHQVYKSFSILRITSFIITLTLIILSFLQNPFRFSPPRQLIYTRNIVDFIINQSSDEPFNFALLSKNNYDPSYRYFFYENDSPIFDLHNKLTEQLFVVCEPWQNDCQPINHPQWEIAAFGWSKIDKEWSVEGTTVFRLVHNKQP